jgi:hypothetical protein
MKLDLQIRILQTMGRMGTDKRSVSPDALSTAINKAVSASTVALSHRFFSECGWLERVGRGDYTASEALITYSRYVAAGAPDALSMLRQAAAGHGWFWPIIRSHAAHGPAPLAEVMVALMTAAEVGEPHRPQIKMLLEWLNHVGLIAVTDETVAIASDQSDTATDATTTRDEVPPVVETTPWQPAGGAVPEPIKKPGGGGRDNHGNDGGGPPIISFDFSISITKPDLAKMTPEQISELFAAIGRLMAVKGAASD